MKTGTYVCTYCGQRFDSRFWVEQHAKGHLPDLIRLEPNPKAIETVRKCFRRMAGQLKEQDT